MKKLALVLALLGLAACTDEDAALNALQQAGYTHINLTGYQFFGCGEHDTFHTGFRAMGPTGRPASGVVCSGWMKGATIRF